MLSGKMAVILRLMGVGWYVGLCVGGGAFLGLMFDRNIGSEPYATVTGLTLGLVLGIVGMLRMLAAILSYDCEPPTGRSTCE